MELCQVCRKPIDMEVDLAVGVVVNGIKSGVLVHRGECDETLANYISKELNGSAATNVDLRLFSNLSELEYFINHGETSPEFWKNK